MQTIQIQLESIEKFEQMVKLLERLRVNFSFWTENSQPPVPNGTRHEAFIRPNQEKATDLGSLEIGSLDEIVGYTGDGFPISTAEFRQIVEESRKEATPENWISARDLLAEVDKW